jgi:P-type Mg2+ transporter
MALPVSGPHVPSPRAIPASSAVRADGFWREPLLTLLSRIPAGLNGLRQAEALLRLERVGPNALRTHTEGTLLGLFLSRFRNPLVLLLVMASAVAAFTGDAGSCAMITTIVLLSVTLDSVQEHRAGRAAERLRRSVAVRVRVVREGAPADLPAADVVPGDIVLLSAGDLAPADGWVLEARDCFVNQSLLTGEPYPVEKHAVEDGEPSADLAGAQSAVFMGTSVVSGTARVLVCRTGARTALGEIGQHLAAKPPPTALELGTRNFGLLILRLAMLLVLLVILVNTARHRPWLESFLFAVALAVGLTPELLPMIVSVTLSRGALRMAAKKVIVKRLAAIHDLGCMTVLCTDKTGTLTEARIRLEKHLDPVGRSSERTLQLAYLNSVFQSGLTSPLDEAILRHGEIDVRGWTKLDEVPFDFERRRVAVLVAHESATPLLVVKGALEDILRIATRYEAGGAHDLRTLDDATRRDLLGRFEALGREGYRVLGIAWKDMTRAAKGASRADEADLVFTGFACFEDPPKTSARAALRGLAARGVAVKILTGDNELVTQHVCRELGIAAAGILTGAEIQRLGDQALEARVAGTTLFCRVTPPQKNRLILALKRRGHVVGYLGDGMNDAPSLHSADVGISVDSGVDVAKEAADLVLLERDLEVLRDGVVEGRRTFGNIMKYVMMGTSSNFGNMFSMAAASLVLPFLPMLPTQVLLNNLLYDVSEVPIPMDRVDDDYIERPHRWDMTFIRNFMLAVGPVSSAFDFLTFYVMLHVFRAGEALFHTGWFIESLATQVLVIFVIRTRGSPLRSRPSRLLTTTSLGVVATAVLLPFTLLGAKLGFVAPPAGFFVILTAMVIVYLLGVEIVKRWFYRRMLGAAT